MTEQKELELRIREVHALKTIGHALWAIACALLGIATFYIGINL